MATTDPSANRCPARAICIAYRLNPPSAVLSDANSVLQLIFPTPHPPGPTRAILEHLGLPARAPPPVPPPVEMLLDSQADVPLDW